MVGVTFSSLFSRRLKTHRDARRETRRDARAAKRKIQKNNTTYAIARRWCARRAFGDPRGDRPSARVPKKYLFDRSIDRSPRRRDERCVVASSRRREWTRTNLSVVVSRRAVEARVGGRHGGCARNRSRTIAQCAHQQPPAIVRAGATARPAVRSRPRRRRRGFDW